MGLEADEEVEEGEANGDEVEEVKVEEAQEMEEKMEEDI